MRRNIALMAVACVALAGAAWAGVVRDPEEGLLEFRSAPDAPVVGDSITLMARFDATRLIAGTVRVTVTDQRGGVIQAFTPTIDAQGQWQATFPATEGMAWARVAWQVREWDDGRIEIEHEDERLWLDVRSGGSGGGGGGTAPSSEPYAYRVTDWPLYSGDDMEIEAVFTTRPDMGSVRLVLEGSGGIWEVRDDDVDIEGNRYVYEFDFHIAQGTWTPTLHWSANGVPYSARQAPFTVGGPLDGRIPSVPSPGGSTTGSDLYWCGVTDWPDHVGDDTEIKAVFNVQPQTVTLIMTNDNSGQSQTFSPTGRDFEGGRYVYEFDVRLPAGTWTPTVQWTSASSTAGGSTESAPQTPITLFNSNMVGPTGGGGGGGGTSGGGGGGGCDAMTGLGLGGLALAALSLKRR